MKQGSWTLARIEKCAQKLELDGAELWRGVEPMRAHNARKFMPPTPAVLPYLRKNCRDIAKLKEGPLNSGGKEASEVV